MMKHWPVTHKRVNIHPTQIHPQSKALRAQILPIGNVALEAGRCGVVHSICRRKEGPGDQDAVDMANEEADELPQEDQAQIAHH